jgi:RHS repeat-associated protein
MFPSSVVGDPVDTLTGAVLERKLEFRLIGPLELAWWRHYDSSQCATRYALGWGHTHEFDRILYLADEKIIYGSPVGQLVAFPPVSNNGGEATAQGYILKRRSTERFELHRHGEPSIEFVFARGARRARPYRLFNADGEIVFFHTPQNRLERIIHSTGANLLANTTSEGLLSRIVLQRDDGREELLLEYIYDERGNVVATSNAAGHGYEFAYDDANRLLRRRGRKGFTFRYLYDDQGRCVFSAGDANWYGVALKYEDRATWVRRPDGGLWLYRFFASGKLSEIVDPLGGSQKFLYDELGRLSHEVDGIGNVTACVYDAAGALTAKIIPTGHLVTQPADINAPDPLVRRIAANPAEYHLGRLPDAAAICPPSRSELASSSLLAGAAALATLRPDQDKVSSVETQFAVRPLGLAWWPPPQRGRIFNELGKLIDQADDFGRERHWSYDASGNLSTYKDFDGGEWDYDYGKWHLLLGLTNPIGARKRLTYTTNEQIASCIDSCGTLSEYRYDLADRLIEVKRHGVVRETYQRDLAGNLIGKYAADGRELLRREIGPGNLLTRRILTSGDEHRFTYDHAGRWTALTTTRDRVECRYDYLGNTSAELRNGLGVEHCFVGWQEPAETTFFGRFVVRFDRSSDGCVAILDPVGGRHDIERPGHGIVIKRIGNGTVETSQYDPLGRCLFSHLRRADGRSWSRRNHWSGEGELRLIEDSRSGEIRHDYDAAHRLCGRTISGRSEVYELDNSDNLLAQPGLSDVVMRDGNRLAAANDAIFEYNDRNHIACQRAADGATDYVYDSRDQLVRATTPRGEWTADYDAIGRRTRKTWQGRTTEFYWYGDQLVAEIASDGRVRIYVYADPLALAPLLFIDYDSVDEAPKNGRVYAVFTDQVGAPVSVEDANGTEVWKAAVAPFGATDVAPTSSLDVALRLPGQYADPELALHYNRFRHYSPVLGRYLQSDPWGIAGGTNLYAYPRNPLLSADVRGLGEEEGSAPRRVEDDAENLSAGARLAREQGLPKPPEGYHYVDVGGQPRVRSNPGSNNEPLFFNPTTRDFEKLPPESAYPRVDFTEEERETVFEQSRNDEGDVLCPCGEKIASPAPEDMDMGHLPGHDYATARNEAIAAQMPRDEFRRQQKDLSNYRAEHPSCNRSHKHE